MNDVIDSSTKRKQSVIAISDSMYGDDQSLITMPIDLVESIEFSIDGQISTYARSASLPVVAGFAKSPDAINIRVSQVDSKIDNDAFIVTIGSQTDQVFDVSQFIDELRLAHANHRWVTLLLHVGTFVNYKVKSATMSLKPGRVDAVISLVKPDIITNEFVEVPKELLAIPSKNAAKPQLCECTPTQEPENSPSNNSEATSSPTQDQEELSLVQSTIALVKDALP